MICRFKSVVLWVVALALFSSFGAWAAGSLYDINVSNTKKKATVEVSFNGSPDFKYSVLHSPERVVMDVKQTAKVKGLPLIFSGQNLVKTIRANHPQKPDSARLVFHLTTRSKVNAVTKRLGNRYVVILTITAEEATGSRQRATSSVSVGPSAAHRTQAPSVIQLNNKPADKSRVYTSTTSNSQPRNSSRSTGNRVVVAIDAGHGGQDPGAIGANGLREKTVNLAIAQQLRKLLDEDPMFTPVMTRSGDYFISVMGRSDVARKQSANILVSIHADAAPNRSANGVSVWVLSNRRANSEMAGWLEQHEKQSELLGGAGDVLANSHTDPYLSQAVLDLQFGHSQRVGYDVATHVLQQMRTVGRLHKSKPEHASLGVLRSPDIPSLLVETGFISNRDEEHLLGSAAHQNRVAQAIHRGLKKYYLANPLQGDPKAGSRSGQSQAKVTRSSQNGSSRGSSIKHKVGRGDTLSSIGKRYNVSVSELKRVNRLSSDVAPLDRMLMIP